jgi:4-carboxymuconolactone decarboxylase
MKTSPASPFAATPPAERIGLPAALDAEQHEAAQALINGPRGGVVGPFRPLLHRPPLLHAVARVGEVLRYQGTLPDALREWTICVVARELANVFEWQMHRPLAEKAGVPAAALAALEAGAPWPADLPADLALAAVLTRELLATHDVADDRFEAARSTWGDAGLVELLTLVGYFAMVSWLMNVSRTPGPAKA